MPKRALRQSPRPGFAASAVPPQPVPSAKRSQRFQARIRPEYFPMLSHSWLAPDLNFQPVALLVLRFRRSDRNGAETRRRDSRRVTSPVYRGRGLKTSGLFFQFEPQQIERRLGNPAVDDRRIAGNVDFGTASSL